MRCLVCRRLCVRALCPACRRRILTPRPRMRILGDGTRVISFYSYEEIEPLLLTKHSPPGWFVFRHLGESLLPCLEPPSRPLRVIAVDDDPTGGYSHTALLAGSLKARGYKLLPGVLRARNRVSYSGKPLSFRLANPRNFLYTGPGEIEAVLVDDVVTSGTTLREAVAVLAQKGVRVREAFVLADVDRSA